MAGRRVTSHADREAARTAKLEALHRRLQEQVAALASGSDWKAWLDVAARFHSYSFRNTMLILAQRPDATQVAGYNAWQALGRQVLKGERGIQVLAPITRRRADTEPDDQEKSSRGGTGGQGREVVGWRVTHVWDVSQTSGEPLPELPAPALLRGQAPAGLWDSLAGQVDAAGFRLERGESGDANGWTHFGDRVVRVRADVDDAQAVKTLAHELGHVLLHDPGRQVETMTAGCRGLMEVEAESVAYLVTSTHGLPTDDYTFPYVAGWATSVHGQPVEQAIADAGKRVLSTAHSILQAATQAPDLVPGAQDALAARADRGVRRATVVRDAASAATSQPVAPSVDRRERLLAAHADAVVFFEDCVRGSWVPAYLEGRGLGQAMEATAPWRVGYAPDSWTSLTAHLRELGYSDATLEASGLCLRASTGRLVDRFRDRLMLPVRDPEGRTVGFIGRAHPNSGDRVPRYLNSPETELYRKGELLFGLAEGALALRTGARPVLVEGPIDVLAVHAAAEGQLAAAAPCGTALTPQQVRLLRDASSPTAPLIVASDGDRAGEAATDRVFVLLSDRAADASAALLRPGEDPAAVLEHRGPSALLDRLTTESEPLTDTVIARRLDAWTGRFGWPEGRIAAVRGVVPLLAKLGPADALRQAHRVAAVVGVPWSTVTNEISNHLCSAAVHHQTSDRLPRPLPRLTRPSTGTRR